MASFTLPPLPAHLSYLHNNSQVQLINQETGQLYATLSEKHGTVIIHTNDQIPTAPYPDFTAPNFNPEAISPFAYRAFATTTKTPAQILAPFLPYFN